MKSGMRGQKERVRGFLSTINGFFQILANEPAGGKLKVLLTYARLKIKSSFFSLVPRFTPKHERIFGWTVMFPDYGMFVYMFEEQFVAKSYWLDTSNRAPMIVDCGANVGMSILFFKHYYPGCRIVAFEPDPRVFKLLESNVRGNGFSDVELHNKAVADAPGTLLLSIDPEQPSGVHSTIIAKSDDRHTLTVEAVKLSDFFERADVVKLDIEGAELQVLQELSSSGKLQNVLQLIIEYHHHLRGDSEDALGRFLRIFEERGWSYHLSAKRVNWSPQPRFQDMLVHAYQPGAATGWAGRS